MTERCLELVKRFEGFSTTPYLCPAGYWTIGYGKVLWSYKGEPIIVTREQAEEMLLEDLMKVELKLRPLIIAGIHPWMLDALVSFAYNIGVYAFKCSTLMRKLNRRDFRDAADEFPRWVYAGGRKLKGLVRRREAERALYLEGLEEVETWTSL